MVAGPQDRSPGKFKSRCTNAAITTLHSITGAVLIQLDTGVAKEEQLSFMTEHPLLARHATDLSSALTREEKQRLWEQLARRLNALGPPTKSSKQWKDHWSRRVMKARRRAAVLNEAARILTLVGADSAFGAPGVRVPAEPDDQQVRTSTITIMLTQSAAQRAPMLCTAEYQ
ncbi:hypothetical protein HPB47_004987 [Ixodes persulcatus]|uniref:Uncharacterized protein n=1 Tax=Ixodes persulcatus TaxID=34615 RepID=A0AC60PE74_IXOPE|nr:hypothetical protein HPB47_004987 [Ixodes persulcatus]